MTRILRAAPIMVAIRVGAVLVSLGASLLAARALAPADRGVLAMMMAVPGLLAMAGVVGLDAANLYYAAQGPGEHRRVLHYSLAYATGAGAAIAVVAVVAAWLVPPLRFGLSLTIFAACASLTAPLMAGTLLLATESGRGRAVGAMAATAGLLALYPIGIVVLMLIQRAGAAELFGAYAISQLAATVALVWLSLRHRGPAGGTVDVGPYFLYAARANPSALAMLLLVRIEVPLIQGLAGPVAVALYATALPMAEILLVVPTVLTLLMLPSGATRAIGAQDVLRLLKVTSVLMVVCATTIGVLAPLVVPRLFGDAYAGAVSILWVLLPGVVLLSIARVMQIHLLSQRRFMIPTVAAIAGLAVAVVGVTTLTPSFGGVGAAAGAVLGFATVAAITAAAVLPEVLRAVPLADGRPAVRQA